MAPSRATTTPVTSPYGQAPTSLIVTLGGKPQIVTYMLDLLLDMGVSPERVVAVHLSPSDPRVQRSIDMVHDELRRHRAYQAHIRFDAVTIRDRPNAVLASSHAATNSHSTNGHSTNGRSIDQVDDFAAAEATWLTMHRLILALKSEGYRIDLCVTGGPRLIGLQAMSAASLLFAPHDRCWHLYTPEPWREKAGEGDLMHLPKKSGARLISVPLLPLGMIAPNLQAAASATPEAIIGERRQMLSTLELRRCEDVLFKLTPRQRKVLNEFALATGRDGAEVQRVADKLHIGEATLNSHKTVILAECRNAWGLKPSAKLTHHFLHEAFGDVPEAVWAKWLTAK